MMKKNLLAASLCVVTLSLLPGCGSKEKEAKEAAVEVTTMEEAPEGTREAVSSVEVASEEAK